ncbi:DUF4439 domain-containing protein [Paraoerskovia marina]|uniref:DUF4439 domain-containing protein n=1 Tax=Paraoerskovia marina TaxID=545619 RepID=A0A1H1TYR7_9CELL|nr:DUF4439 domain-containing protein [Paraoerskovia marina]SDS65387.1 protein of unknown function [Paraoerskovia marina]
MDAEPLSPTVPTRRRRLVRAVLGAAAVVALAACGVRIDTPPPSEPSPDTHEILRSTVVADALDVERLATSAAEGTDDADVSAALLQAAAFAQAHAQQLGGTYESGLADAAVTPEATTSPDDEAARVTDVVEALAGASVRARGAADTTNDGPLARLLASISTSDILAAEQLGDLTGAELPETVVPTTAVVPETLPSGVSAADLTTLVEAEDAAGYVYEVQAARTADAGRERSADRAPIHRDRADDWARLLEIDSTAQDPRSTAYVMPEAESVAARGQLLENNLAASYASLVGTSGPSGRTELVDLLADSSRSAVSWGAPLTAFPGLPEQE